MATLNSGWKSDPATEKLNLHDAGHAIHKSFFGSEIDPIDRVVIHAADENGVRDAQRGLDAVEIIEHRCSSPCPVNDIAACAVNLGYRWGVSDGN